MKFIFLKLPAGLLVSFFFAVALFAQDTGSASKNTSNAPEKNSIRSCGGTDKMIETGGVAVPEDQIPESVKKEKEEIFLRIRESSAALVESHRELSRYRDSVKKMYKHTIYQGFNVPDRGQLVIDTQSIFFNFNDSHELDCIVLESYYSPVDRPDNSNKRIIRVFYPDIHNMEVITQIDHKTYRTSVPNLNPMAQLKTLRKMEKVIGDAAVLIDLEVGKEVKKQEDLMDWQIGY